MKTILSTFAEQAHPDRAGENPGPGLLIRMKSRAIDGKNPPGTEVDRNGGVVIQSARLFRFYHSISRAAPAHGFTENRTLMRSG